MHVGLTIDALVFADQVVRLEPRNANVHLTRCRVVSKLGQYPEALEALRGYVESRTSKTDYPYFRAQGYDCGSGPTESQCGTLTHRVKGAGMRWDADNAESMMVLAALDHSQQWTAYWKLQRAA